jgi:hypothetical protein
MSRINQNLGTTLPEFLVWLVGGHPIMPYAPKKISARHLLPAEPMRAIALIGAGCENGTDTTVPYCAL